MLNSLFGLFSRDLAIDLGTTHTRLYLRGTGILCEEPTVVAVRNFTDGRRQVIAVGEEAKHMVGRTPTDIDAIRPVQGTQIMDTEVASVLLLYLVRTIHERERWLGPHIVMSVPSSFSSSSAHHFRHCAHAAHARQVHLVPRTIAAALGADLDIRGKSGHLIVEMGGGSTEIAVLSSSKIIAGKAIDVSGESLDQAIIRHLRSEYALLIGSHQSQKLKHQLSEYGPYKMKETVQIAGRCLRKGVPAQQTIPRSALDAAIQPEFMRLAVAIQEVLDEVPKPLRSHIQGSGIMLTGGPAQMPQVQQALKHHLQLPVLVAPRPTSCTIRGLGQVLEAQELLTLLAS